MVYRAGSRRPLNHMIGLEWGILFWGPMDSGLALHHYRLAGVQARHEPYFLFLPHFWVPLRFFGETTMEHRYIYEFRLSRVHFNFDPSTWPVR